MPQKKISFLKGLFSNEIRLQDLNVNIDHLPKSFKGFKICHISDLHNIDLFDQRPDILTKIIQQKPDIFIISGDSINSTKIDNALKTIITLESITLSKNIYITTGNHEYFEEHHQKSKTREFTQTLLKMGFNILRNNFKKISINNDDIFIIGIDDPHGYKNETNYLKYHLDGLTEKIPKDKVKILISHRPEKINLYSQYNIDLVFSGHSHGGHFKIPFINRGLIAPHQGLLAKYVDGIYKVKNTQLVVSPGIGNETIIPRWNNPGKIFFVTLH